MSGKIKFLPCIAALLSLTVFSGSVAGGGYNPYAYLNYSSPEYESVSAEWERLDSLDKYSLDNVKVFGDISKPNDNKMNVIFIVPDGQNVAESTLARWVKGSPLSTDEYMCGMVRTFCADSAITDSSAAATAFATGYKTNEGYEGILPSRSDMPGAVPVTEFNNQMPYATVLESARLAGKSTGIVVTSPMSHGTPAGFTTHVDDRNQYAKIAKQQMYAGIDVMLGGGFKYFRDSRTDGRDLFTDADNLGYTFVNNLADLQAAQADKLLGVFASDDMNYDIDRGANEPSLEDMTRKAIEILNRNENGFFLLVESSKIDYASHAHDPVGVVSESLAFDRAFGAAVEFAKEDGNTVVIACPDHGNSGMSIGVGQAGYAQTHIDSYIAPIKRALRTGAGIYPLLDSGRTNLVQVVAEYYGITDLTYDEINHLKKTPEIMKGLGEALSRRINIGWIGGGHTGEDVPLWVYAPEGAERLCGVVDNTDVSHYMQKILGVDNGTSTEKLYVAAGDTFRELGATVKFESISDSRAVITVELNGVLMRLPVDTSVALINNDVYVLGGLTVVSGGRTYVSEDAVSLLRSAAGV